MLEDTAEKFDFAVSSEKFKYTCRRYSFLTKSAKIKPTVHIRRGRGCYRLHYKNAKIKTFNDAMITSCVL